MKFEVGQYRDTDITEIPTDYLEWSISHVAMTDEMEQAIVAEIARRTNAERVEGETPLQRLGERVSQAVTKFAARHGH